MRKGLKDPQTTSDNPARRPRGTSCAVAVGADQRVRLLPWRPRALKTTSLHPPPQRLHKQVFVGNGGEKSGPGFQGVAKSLLLEFVQEKPSRKNVAG